MNSFVPSGGVYAPDWWALLFVFVMLWSLFWQGLALWQAAKRGDKKWFIFFLLVHTAGIVELVYLKFVVRMSFRLRRTSGK